MPAFSVIIPTWNNLAYVQRCIESVRRHSTFTHEIVLHVNDGSEGTLAWARRQGLRHSHSSQNIGICLAVNEATALGSAEHVVFMNDDMVALPGWDEALARSIPSDPLEPYLLSATMIEPEASNNPCVIVRDYGRSIETFREEELLATFAALPHFDWSGASWPPTLVSRRWWNIVGGYSTELSPGMASDTDFAMKLWAAGCRLFKGVADSRVYHFQRRSTGRVRRNDGSTQFLAKWGITQSTFSRSYLRRGEPFSGPLPDPDPKALGGARLKSVLKRRLGKLTQPIY